mmetsp:Transcript_9671/g.18154  ORF Transcript_9671/g.18154 Transcript_9671/m.18154 type:complete len:531 (+) Transcript_9671:336-1928(+)
MSNSIVNECIQDAGGGDVTTQLECVAQILSVNQKAESDLIAVFFLVFCATLVFFMQSGFAMICSGCVRKKNVQNTMLKSLLDVCGSSIAFYLVGYAFAFGGNPEKKSFIGTSHFLLLGADDDNLAMLYTHWFFQFAFAATAATIVAGTLAERCQMNAYLYFSMALTGFVYPVIVHSIWSSSGFLNASTGSNASESLLGVGMIDFAGSGVVHVTGGSCALLATLLLGPRKGRFYDDRGNKLEEPKVFPGHSKSLQMLGTMILWFGWYGFNAGSAVDVFSSDSSLNLPIISAAVVNSTLSGSIGGVVALFVNLVIQERLTGEPLFKLSSSMNGALAGLVAVTGCCGLVEPWAAVLIGFIAGLLYLLASHLLIKFCIDDAVDAIPVHLAGGVWGVIATGLFASPRQLKFWYGLSENDLVKHVGWFYSWGRGSTDFSLLACQLIGLIFILAWTAVTMFPFFFLLNYMGLFRSDALEEIVGLDVSYHGYTPRTFKDEEVPAERVNEYLARSGRRYTYNLDPNPEEDNEGVDRFGD